MINDMLQMLPETDGFVDDVTISQTYHPEQERAMIRKMENRLVLVIKWGEMWQIAFAAQKTQLMIIWRAPVAVSIRFGGKTITAGEKLDILGIVYDKWLMFRQHISNIAGKAAGKLAVLRRTTWLTNQRDLETLYKSQVRSVMEFSPLAWGGASPTHLALLDKVQRRAERIIYGEGESRLQPLQVRRDVAGLSALYKVQEERAEHLQDLRQPPRPITRLTRESARAVNALAVPRCHTLHHQRQFVAVYVKMWNEFWTTGFTGASLQAFKVAVNKWLTRERT